MKKIILAIILLSGILANAQVAIGKSSVTNTSVSLEFGTGNRGIVLPWVTSAASVTNSVDGTLIFDTTDKKVKYKKAGAWFDLTVDTTGIVDTNLQDAKTELTSAKAQIGGNPNTDTTSGILVLAATDKAMILPKTTYNSIINPAAGMMIYDTTAKQLAVFNGYVWSFWKP